MIPSWIRTQELNDREFFKVKFICERCGVEMIIKIISSQQYVLFGESFTDVHSKCQEIVQQEEKE